MNKLIRLYNQNRLLVIAIVIIIALILIVIYTLNALAAEMQEKRSNERSNLKDNNIDKTAISQKDTSAITGEKVENNESNIQTIKRFIEYCNEGKYDLAYDMLSNECKTEVYPSLERFKTIYVDRMFNIKRMYTLENWYSSLYYDTYFVKYIEDILATGNVNSENNMSDYITVDKRGNKNYLNISNFVGYSNVNKSQTINGITVNVNKIYMYIDYTVLDFTVKNATNKMIKLDTKEKQRTMYLYDGNSIKYEASLNEIADEVLKIREKNQMNFKIKFNKMYNPESRAIKGFGLKDVVLNYENYIEGAEEKEQIEFDIKV